MQIKIILVFLLIIFTSFAQDENILKKGSRRNFENIPILELSGSYYEVGYQYGYLLKDELQEILQEVNKIEKIIKKGLKWYQRPFYPFYIYNLKRKAKKRVPARYKEEIRGISAGSGIRSKDFLLIQAGASLVDASCTSIISNTGTQMIHGRNFDISPNFLGKYPVIVKYSINNKKVFVNAGIIGYQGVFNGINEDEICVTLNYGKGSFEKKNSGIPMGYKLREVLEEDSKFDEVKDYIEKKEADEPGWILAVSSLKEKKGGIFDIFDNNVVFTEAKEVIFATNQIFSPERAKDDELRKEYLDFYWAMGIPNISRNSKLKEILRREKIETVEEMIEVLRNSDFYSYKNQIGMAGFPTVSNEYTLMSTIFKEGELYFSTGFAYASKNKFYKYNLKDASIQEYMPAATGYIKAKEFGEWFVKIQELSMKKDYEEMLNVTDIETISNYREFRVLFKVWEKEKKLIENKKIEEELDNLIKKYPDYFSVYSLKGIYFEKEKKYKEAIKYFEKALESPIIFEYNKIFIYETLYKLNKKIKNKEKSKKNLSQMLKILDTYSDMFKFGKFIKKFHNKYKQK